MSKQDKIQSFDFKPGRILAKKYQIIDCVGRGWEGEVYLLKELSTGIERAGKFFFPHQNPGNRSAIRYAKKLHKLRHCHILIQYISQETIIYKQNPITFLVSEYVEGEILSEFLKRHSGNRLPAFQALHFLYALTKGMEEIHHAKEYHGDLHTDNIIIQRYGLSFDLKLLDMYHWDKDFTKPESIKDDLCDVIKLFYESLGGAKYYNHLPDEIKKICCGLKRSLIVKKFRTTSKLRDYLEKMEWQ